ncbi:hypothetical protein QYM36_014534 [Artemia franciscana]|uniref:Uncharacterized protein n=1 Tax=Artemia franciscana TaxID=6661 RepID=A0AA88HCM9_ARTSF|nr:hypothetical protein QYM36_014534 [Artemia franciscana]
MFIYDYNSDDCERLKEVANLGHPALHYEESIVSADPPLEDIPTPEGDLFFAGSQMELLMEAIGDLTLVVTGGKIAAAGELAISTMILDPI